MRVSLACIGLVALASCPAPTPTPPPPPPPAGPASVEVQVLAINDFHGALVPAPGGELGDVGGAAFLAGALAALRTDASIFVAAGDIIGASPLESGLFHDEPTIEAMNLMGLALSAVGNHEFDEGPDELSRMQAGGCHPVDGCEFDDDAFAGAQFGYLAANVYDHKSGNRLFPPYAIEEIGGVTIAFLGLATVNTPSTTVGTNVDGIDFVDEADTVNAFVPELHAQGADNIVVLIHDGGGQQPPDGVAADANGCDGFAGRIIDVVTRMSPAVKLVVSGHTHSLYNCVVAGKLVTSAGAKGRFITDARLTFDTKSGALASATAVNVEVVDDDVVADAAVQAVVDQAVSLSAPLANATIGSITGDLFRDSDDTGEFTMGEVIADAMLAATTGSPANAQVALMNNGGVRAGLAFGRSGDESVDGLVTFGEAFRVQPFQNLLVTVTITGRELLEVLTASADGSGKGLQVAGVHVVLHPGLIARPLVIASDVEVGGVPLALDAEYRVTTNSITAVAASGYAQLEAGRDPVGGLVDLDALVAYFAQGPVSPPPLDRIDLAP